MSLCGARTRLRPLQRTLFCRFPFTSTSSTKLTRKLGQPPFSSIMASSIAAMTTDSALRQRPVNPASRDPAALSNSPSASARSFSTNHSHSHSHPHSPFGGHSHSHSHSPDSEEAAALAAAFSGANDRGSRIILLGLASNVALTAAKGIGGVMLHSASLLADAGHSLSDLLGDIVVLFSWRLSRRPASRAFQYGYGQLACIRFMYHWLKWRH